MRQMLPLLEITDFPSITRVAETTLQVNLGYKCNQRCVHCHVGASPERYEMMDQANLELVLSVMHARSFSVLDLTGGAPEMHPEFKSLVRRARADGFQVIDRCNLTILFEYEGLAEFLAEQEVAIVASLPCYSRLNVDQQRGAGVFDESIRGLKLLNSLGYGRDANLPLHLVYNPQGAVLPPPQEALSREYHLRLKEDFNIEFNELMTITNMPIQRFGSMLVSKGLFEQYMALLHETYNAENIKHVMCRSMISVDWQGFLYDCDFNQQLDLPMNNESTKGNRLMRPHLKHLLNPNYSTRSIQVADHCFGCTAGQGSSCGGALVDECQT